MSEKLNNNNIISNQSIDQYIQKVSELSQSEHKILTREELEKIASELGINKEEIEIAKQQSQAHFIRGQSYFNSKYWDDTIDELQEAIVFNPANLEMLNLLIKAHLARWESKPNKEDQLQVKLRVKQCLEIKPDDQESLKLLTKLDRLINRNNKYKIGFISLFLILLGATIGYFFLNGISLKIFSKQETEIKQLKSELIEQINNNKKLQDQLYIELEKNQDQINKNIQRKIDQSEEQIRVLRRQNEILINKLNQLEKQLITPNP